MARVPTLYALIALLCVVHRSSAENYGAELTVEVDDLLETPRFGTSSTHHLADAPLLDHAVFGTEVTVIGAGSEGANGVYSEIRPSPEDVRLFDSLPGHRQFVKKGSDEEFRIVKRYVYKQVADEDGAMHSLPGTGQWVLYSSNPGKSPKYLYAAASDWPVPPLRGWMAAHGRRPLPRVDLAPMPHPCDIASLGVDECAAQSNSAACVRDALDAVADCVVKQGWESPQDANKEALDLSKPSLPACLLDTLFHAQQQRVGSAAETVGATPNQAGSMSLFTPGPSAAGTKPTDSQNHVGTSKSFQLASTLRCGAAQVLPHRAPARWCACVGCGTRAGRVLMFQPSATRTALTTLMTPVAGTTWHEYFSVSDHVHAVVVPRNAAAATTCDTVIQQPSWFFAARRLHNLFDMISQVLLPLYQSMEGVYGAGQVPLHPDTLLWIQHDAADKYRGADASLSPSLADDVRVLGTGPVNAGGALSLLRLFTSNAIASREDWDDVQHVHGTRCFQSLHTGLDPTRTFFGVGVTAAVPRDSIVNMLPHTHTSSLGVPPSVLSAQQDRFLDWMLEGMDIPPRGRASRLDSTSTGGVGERVVVDLPSVCGAGHRMSTLFGVALSNLTNDQAPSTIDEEDLELLSMPDLAETLRLTTVLVTEAGRASATAAAFLPRGAVLVLLTEPGLFGWKWMHTNLALLSHVHVVPVARSEDALPTQGYGGVADYTQVEPSVDGNEHDLACDAEVIDEILETVRSLRSGSNVVCSRSQAAACVRTVPDVCEHDSDGRWFC